MLRLMKRQFHFVRYKLGRGIINTIRSLKLVFSRIRS